MRLSHLICLGAIVAHFATATAIISVQPSIANTTIGSLVTLDVDIFGAADLYAYQFDLSYDPTLLSAVSVTNGLFVSSIAEGTFISGSIDNVGGMVSATADSKIGLVPGVSGSGTLAIFQFAAIGTGNSPISIPTLGVILLDSNLNDIPFTTSDGTVNVSATTGVPEPGSFALVLLVLSCAAALRLGSLRRKRHSGILLNWPSLAASVMFSVRAEGDPRHHP